MSNISKKTRISDISSFSCWGILLAHPVIIFLGFHNSKQVGIDREGTTTKPLQESPANAEGTRDSSACMKAPCEKNVKSVKTIF